MTVCGGKNEIRLFAIDSIKKKIDLSTPLNNVRISPTIFFILKTEGIYKLIASETFPNRFLLITKPVAEL